MANETSVIPGRMHTIAVIRPVWRLNNAEINFSIFIFCSGQKMKNVMYGTVLSIFASYFLAGFSVLFLALEFLTALIF